MHFISKYFLISFFMCIFALAFENKVDTEIR